MGHDRVGMLPRTKPWARLVEDIVAAGHGMADTGDVADRVLQNVRHRYRRLMQDDSGTAAAFQFLVFAALSGRPPRATELESHGFRMPDDPTPLRLAADLQEWTSGRAESSEYRELAWRAAADALATWFAESKPKDVPLFGDPVTAAEVWPRAAAGSGFCELARLFFAGLTQRYLCYFLDRAASVAIADVEGRRQFAQALDAHLDAVSRHAFETAKITQSFAAGWFNKHAAEGVPTHEQIRGFMAHAFGKLRDELTQEEGTG